MTTYRHALPQLGKRAFLTDGGIETTMIFHNGLDLPEFATFVLLENEDGINALQDYYRQYLDIATAAGAGFVLESTTWRANRDWGAKLGYDADRLADVNRRSIEFLENLRAEYDYSDCPIVISGNIGPRGDGYVAGEQMSAHEASGYHHEQINIFSETNADMITAMTMTYPEEAIGVVRASKELGMPVVIGFTTETDGCLPNGTSLEAAIRQVDESSGGGPDYYMINCAHPDHFSDALADGADWTGRIQGIRANASRLSHAELDEAEHLDDGNPQEFGRLYKGLHDRFPALNVFGGCCGTDHRHVKAVQQSVYV